MKIKAFSVIYGAPEGIRIPDLPLRSRPDTMKPSATQCKKILGNTACISGNLPIYLLEYGTKQQVIDACKSLIDTCAPGGGYIFDTNGSIDNAKRENIEAMYDTVLNYGRK